MAGTVVADRLEAASTSQLVIENGVALTPPTIVDVNNVQIGTFCRAWVNFNGTGTVAIRASFNVSSITDNNTGDYTINFTNAMPDANYAINTSGSSTTTTGFYPGGLFTFNTGNVRFRTVVKNVAISDAPNYGDPAFVLVSVFR
jgi:hypothetical protein